MLAFLDDGSMLWNSFITKKQGDEDCLEISYDTEQNVETAHIPQRIIFASKNGETQLGQTQMVLHQWKDNMLVNGHFLLQHNWCTRIQHLCHLNRHLSRTSNTRGTSSLRSWGSIVCYCI